MSPPATDGVAGRAGKSEDARRRRTDTGSRTGPRSDEGAQETGRTAKRLFALLPEMVDTSEAADLNTPVPALYSTRN